MNQNEKIEHLEKVLREIAQLPVHPCDDARNQAALMVAKNKAQDALMWKPGR